MGTSKVRIGYGRGHIDPGAIKEDVMPACHACFNVTSHIEMIVQLT